MKYDKIPKMIDSESVYRLLFENSTQGMVLWQDEKIILANKRFAEMIGYEKDELLSFSRDEVLNLIRPQDGESALARFYDLLHGDEFSKDHIYRFARRNGETRWWSMGTSIIEYKGQPARLDIYDDITERKVAQDSLTRGRELMVATLDVLPVGVCLTDETGHYRMMNDAYCAIYEYKREEMLGQHYSVIMPPDQIALANAHYARLLKGDVGIPVERKRQRKDGSIVYIEAANALVTDEDGHKMVITTVRDISERKRGTEIIRLRLELQEYAKTHPYHELMQKALDEIGELTGSPIGFYHFVDEDRQSLSLQAWSTRTLAEFCQAEGKGMHYPIDEAGVWADCVRQREPVIHNDYAAVPHRKGLPEGHAELLRELVVPIIHNDRVVAVLGVGNKQSDYGEQDAELVSYIADVVWSIVEQKQSDEKIRQLNARLEQQVMEDELTGLPNRRAFFIRGKQEIERCQRHQTALSLLWLDIDGFKSINDTYGHDVGDLVLRRFAQVLSKNIRGIDLAARMGGEEFSMLLPDTEAKNAVKLARRIRLAVEQEKLQIQDHIVNLTVSIGVAAYGKNSSNLEDIIKQADNGLYQAKKQGRNRVVYLDS